MASARRSAPPSASASTTALSSTAAAALPPLSALFLINFDVKAGYTIVWKRAAPAVELEGLVEYKSLPSGLHTVADDLIYFVHGTQHAGLSAFVNEPTEEEELRNARMIAVGILVPLSYGRLGRAWRHAENLKDMAACVWSRIRTGAVLICAQNTNGIIGNLPKMHRRRNSSNNTGTSTMRPPTATPSRPCQVYLLRRSKTAADTSAIDLPLMATLSPPGLLNINFLHTILPGV